MRRVGAIYTRDLSKSRERGPSPLRTIDTNSNQRQYGKGQHNEIGIGQNFIKREYPREKVQTIDFEPNSMSSRSFQQSQCSQYSLLSEPPMLKQITHLSSILKQISLLKTCNLSTTQTERIYEVEERLLNYERALLQKQKKNYL